MVVGRHDLTLDLRQYRLDNGLDVMLLREPAVPIVAVDLWYHVGSKDEPADRTGLAHLFEHLMFEGSANYDAEYFRPLEEAGAAVNGSTSKVPPHPKVASRTSCRSTRKMSSTLRRSRSSMTG